MPIIIPTGMYDRVKSIQGKDRYTKLLLHMDGSDNGTTFTDECGNTVTRSGAVTKTGTKKFGTASGYFDGTDDFLSLANSDAWDFGSGDFIIDVQIKATVLPAAGAICVIANTGAYNTSPTGGWTMAIRNNSGTYTLYFCFFNASGFVAKDVFKTFSSSPDATFYHLAIIRHGNNLYASIDGALSNASDVTSIANVTNTNQLLIGKPYGTTYKYFGGYIDELRISKGIARWTSNFTPPVCAYY